MKESYTRALTLAAEMVTMIVRRSKQRPERPEAGREDLRELFAYLDLKFDQRRENEELKRNLWKQEKRR